MDNRNRQIDTINNYKIYGVVIVVIISIAAISYYFIPVPSPLNTTTTTTTTTTSSSTKNDYGENLKVSPLSFGEFDESTRQNLRTRLSQYSSVSGTSYEYIKRLKGLQQALSSKLCPSNSTLPLNLLPCSVYTNTTVVNLLDCLTAQIQQWESYEKMMEYSIQLYHHSLFPSSPVSSLYQILLKESAKDYSHLVKSNYEKGNQDELDYLLEYFTSSDPKILLKLNRMVGGWISGNINEYFGVNMQTFNFDQAMKQFLESSVESRNEWITTFQKTIVKMKFQTKSLQDKLERLNQPLAEALGDAKNTTDLLSHPFNGTSNTNIVHSFLENVADVADSVESKIKDSQKIFEEEVSKGASLETVVKYNEKGEIMTDRSESGSPVFKYKVKVLKDENDPKEKREVATTLVDIHNNQYVLSKPNDPTMHYEDNQFIYDIVILLILSFTFAWLFEWVGLPLFFGYVLAGIIVGPTGFHLVKNYIQIGSLAQFGVYFLIFILGIEFSPEKISKVWKIAVFGCLIFTIILILIALSFAYWWTGSTSLGEASMFAICLALSSTAVSLKMIDNDAAQRPFGRIMMGILVVQDMVLCLVLAIFPLIKSGNLECVDIGRLLALVSLFALKFSIVLLAVYYVSKFLANKITNYYKTKFYSLSENKSRSGKFSLDLYALGLIITCLCMGKLCEYLGLSMELGCFLAGITCGHIHTSLSNQALSSALPHYDTHDVFVEKAISQLSPISDLFTIFFFNSIGLHVNPHFLIGEATGLITLSLATVTAKIGIMFCMLTFGNGMDWKNSLFVAVGLSHISEFSFVIAGKSKRAGLFSRESYYIMVGITSTCLIIVPILWKILTKLLKFPHQPILPAFSNNLSFVTSNNSSNRRSLQEGTLMKGIIPPSEESIKIFNSF